MGAGIEALLRSEGRYVPDIVPAGVAIDDTRADVVVADSASILEHGGPVDVPTIVLLDPSADRASVEARAPAAHSWLATTVTGEELIAAIDAAAASTPTKPAPIAPPPVSVPAPAAPRTPAPPIARAPVAEAPAAAVAPVAEAPAAAVTPGAAIAAEPRRAALEGVGLVVFGVAAAAVSLSFLWLALRP